MVSTSDTFVRSHLKLLPVGQADDQVIIVADTILRRCRGVRSLDGHDRVNAPGGERRRGRDRRAAHVVETRARHTRCLLHPIRGLVAR